MQTTDKPVIVTAGGLAVLLAATTLTLAECMVPAHRASRPSQPGAASVVFAGYTWHVRSNYGMPGPNRFDSANVWVDASGFLHLKIAHRGDRWSTAELYTRKPLGFGTYQFQLLGHPEAMDGHVVLGLFNYPPPSIGPDGSNEIDIEFSNWGGAQSEHASWTVWPANKLAMARTVQPFDASANTGTSTHRFKWHRQRIDFQALAGWTDGNDGEYAHWAFTPADYLNAIPQTPLPLHMNLWLFDGPPSNGKEVEIVVTEFKYIPG
jgi:hypothetical protein